MPEPQQPNGPTRGERPVPPERPFARGERWSGMWIENFVPRPATTTNPLALVIFGLFTAAFGAFTVWMAVNPTGYLSTLMFATLIAVAVAFALMALLFWYCAYRFHTYNKANAAYERDFERYWGGPAPRRKTR